MRLLVFLLTVSTVFGQTVQWKTGDTNPFFVWQRTDGGISYTRVYSDKPSDVTTAVWLQSEALKARQPDFVGNPIVQHETDFPDDWYFRDAWVWNGATSKVAHHRGRAEALHRKRLRERTVEKYKYDPDKRDALLRSIAAQDLTTPATLNQLKSAGPVEITTDLITP